MAEDLCVGAAIIVVPIAFVWFFLNAVTSSDRNAPTRAYRQPPDETIQRIAGTLAAPDDEPGLVWHRPVKRSYCTDDEPTEEQLLDLDPEWAAENLDLDDF